MQAKFIYGPKDAVNKLKISIKNRGLIYKLLLSLPIIIFGLPILLSGGRLAAGDADYQFQLYEAFRRSVLEFGQFPLWNPWVGGGLPLLANIQFGLISIQTPFILLFGSIVGFKISYIAYLLIGFFGFRALLTTCFKTPELRAVLLGFIWTFGTLSTYRMYGHFTFLLFHLVPWALLYFFGRHHKKNWLKLSLVLSLLVWSSPHYATIMTFLVISILFLLEIAGLVISKKISLSICKKELKVWAKVAVTVSVLCAYRIYIVLSFTHDFPRPGGSWPEPYFGILKGLATMFYPIQFGDGRPTPPAWSWLEASAYIGVMTGLAILLILFAAIQKKRAWKTIFSYSPVILLVTLGLCFVLAQGRFANWAPYSLLQHLPMLDSMRVAMRWFIWCSIFSLLIIGAYKSKRFGKIINGLLLISCFELFFISQPILNNIFTIQPQQYQSPTSSFEQQKLFDTGRNTITFDENLYATTKSNIGQIIVGDALVDTRQPESTIRCGLNQGCQFIKSLNAKIAYWSPNKIILSRTGPGEIELDMNPGSGWRVNDQYIFSQQKTTDPKQQFIITDLDSQTYTIEYAPKLSPNWLWWWMNTDRLTQYHIHATVNVAQVLCA